MGECVTSRTRIGQAIKPARYYLRAEYPNEPECPYRCQVLPSKEIRKEWCIPLYVTRGKKALVYRHQETASVMIALTESEYETLKKKPENEQFCFANRYAKQMFRGK